MNGKLTLWISIFLLLVCFGCRKEKDTSSPIVTFHSPSPVFSAHVPQTFTVRVSVSDDKGLESLSITLADENGVPIAPTATADLSGTSATIEREIVVTNEQIQSGNYQLIARAFDGTNEGRAFQPMFVQAAPLRLRAVYVVPPFGTNPSVVTKIDSAGIQSTFTTVSELYGADVDSYSQHLFLASGDGQMTALPTSPVSSLWQSSYLNMQGTPYFTNLSLDPFDGNLYFGSNDGYIRGFTGSGSQRFTAQALTDHRPYASLVLGGIRVIEQRHNTLSQKKLVTYVSGGAIFQQWPLDLDLIGMFRRNDNTLIAMGNRNGDGVIQERYMDQGGVFEMQVLQNQLINATVRISDVEFVISVGGQLKRFNMLSTGTSNLANMAADALAYDAANNVLYVGASDQLTMMDPSNGNVLGSMAMPTPIGKILPLLNR